MILAPPSFTCLRGTVLERIPPSQCVWAPLHLDSPKHESCQASLARVINSYPWYLDMFSCSPSPVLLLTVVLTFPTRNWGRRFSLPHCRRSALTLLIRVLLFTCVRIFNTDFCSAFLGVSFPSSVLTYSEHQAQCSQSLSRQTSLYGDGGKCLECFDGKLWWWISVLVFLTVVKYQQSPGGGLAWLVASEAAACSLGPLAVSPMVGVEYLMLKCL